MPKYGPARFLRYETSDQSASKSPFATSLMFLILFTGCGGGEDFSKPPAQIQGQLSKVDSAPAAEPIASGVDGTTPSDTSETATLDKPENVAATEPAGVVADPAAPLESTVTDATAVAPTNTGSQKIVAPADSASTTPSTTPASSESTEVMTASGKSAEAIAEKKAANSEKSVMGNAGGLLGSLKGKSDKGAAAAANPASNPDAPQITARFGRMALSRLQWLQLVSELRSQFFIATTPDGNGLAGSSGERSLEIIHSQLAVRSQAATAAATGPTEVAVEPVHIPVSGLPGIINSIELTNDGKQVLVGTTDGRLLVRSAASTIEWDLFARDLFLYQDQHRRTARLSHTAIVAIRSLPDNRFLTVDGAGKCAFWNMNEAILPITQILEMTIEQANSPEAETIPIEPAASFQVSGFEVLSITISDDLKLGAIVTSSEEVSVFQTDTGTLIETLTTKQFADTQPVCVEFIADGKEILVGLADGRILRRGLGGNSVSGVDDQGQTVDYDTIFVPDVQGQVRSVTSIRRLSGSRAIYFGTIDGTVVRFDMSQRRIDHSKKRHAASVIEFVTTKHGVLSVGRDRAVQLFDVPITAHSAKQKSEIVFQLPHDETLDVLVAEEPQAPNSVAPNSSQTSTRPTQTRITEKPSDAVDLSLAGLRPADSTLALFGHQLRSEVDAAKLLELRKKILQHRGENSKAEGLGKETEEIPDGPPLRVAEVTTQMQFTPGKWSRIVLAISDDGTTAAAVHNSTSSDTVSSAIAGSMSLYDMTTGIALRHWPQPVPARSQHLKILNGVLIANPAVTRFWSSTGLAERDPLRPVSASLISTDSKAVFLGGASMIGVAMPALTRFNPSDGTKMSGFDLFEFMITAMASSSNGEHLYIATREREQTRLLEVSPVTLSIEQEVFRHPLKGRIPSDMNDPSLLPQSGTTLIQPSPGDKFLLTWGSYENGEKLLLWKRGNAGWPQENVTPISVADARPDLNAIDQPVTFVNQQDSRLAILTANGLLILGTRKVTVENAIPIPAVSDHRPPCLFTPDGKWLLAGDGDGAVWAVSLINPNSSPLKFAAQTGPVAGISISPNGRYLVTIGEENVLRSWRVDGFLKR